MLAVRMKSSWARTQRVPLTEAMVELVAAGCGVTALGTWAFKTNDPKIRTLRLGSRGVQRVWRAVHLRARTGLEPLQQFISVVRGLLPLPVVGVRGPSRAPRGAAPPRAVG